MLRFPSASCADEPVTMLLRFGESLFVAPNKCDMDGVCASCDR
jgi:hypothetical protein